MNNLPELRRYHKYELFNSFGKSKPWYLVPYEIIKIPITKYELHKFYVTNLGVYVYCRTFPKWIKYLTNNEYNEERWYRRYILNDLTELPYKCEICGADKYFISVSKGYLAECEYPNYCAGKITHLRYEGEYFSKSLNSVSSQARGRSTQFKKKGNPDDLCAFYICRDLNHQSEYKYGITGDYIHSRSRLFYGSFINYHILFTAKRYEIADLEGLIKIKLDSIDEHFNDFKLFKKVFLQSVNELGVTNTYNYLEFYNENYQIKDDKYIKV